MFPPMQLFAATGRTLDDLEKNNLISRWWQGPNTVFGALASLALSITVGPRHASVYITRIELKLF